MEICFELQNCFPNYCIEYVNLPSYIECFYKTSFKIILVYKKSELNVIPRKKSSCASNSASQLDLTGSPLKTNLYEGDDNETFVTKLDLKRWKDEEELHSPITLEEARNIINKYNSLICNTETQLNGIWCVCNDNNEDIILLGSDSGKNLFSRNVIKISKFCSGDIETVNEMLSAHKTKTKNILHTVKCQSELKSVYTLFGCPSLNGAMEESFSQDIKSNGSIQIEFLANKSGLYSIVEDNIASINLVIQCTIGHYDNEAIILWQQLELLHELIKILELHANDTDLDVQKITLPFISFHNNQEDIMDRIEEVFETTEQITRLRQLASEKDIQFIDLHRSILNINTRSNKDFTDMLWDVLISIQSFTELSNTFQYIFEKIYRNEKNIYVDFKNNTEIACSIRDIKNGRAVITKLTGTRPLQLLIDIGFEKLSKDYKHIFLSTGLANAEQLFLNKDTTGAEKKFFEDYSQDPIRAHSSALGSQFSICPESRISTDTDAHSRKTSLYSNRKTVVASKLTGVNNLVDVNILYNKLNNLARIHTVLDIISFVNINFQLSLSSMLKVTHEALNTFLQTSRVTSFTDLVENSEHTLTVKLTKDEIILQTSYRTMWRFILSTENNNRGVTSVFLQTSSPIFPSSFDSSQGLTLPTSLDNSQGCTINGNTNNQYYSYELSHMWSKFGP